MDEPLRGKRILAVDDSPLVRAFLRKALAERGAEVHVAAGGQMALDFCEGEAFDLVLLDQKLPDLEGLEVLRRLRARNRTTAVVMLTGAADVKTALAAMREGADGFCGKEDLGGGAAAEFHHALEQALLARRGKVANEQMARLKDEFHLLLSNDLRTPIGNVILGLESVLAGEVGELSADQREVLGAAHKEAQGLLGLISDFLDLSAIEAGRLRLSRVEVELGELVGLCAQSARAQAVARGQELWVDLPPTPVLVEGDVRRLKQVFANLLSNAIKYTPRGGRITVAMGTADGHVQTRVADNGAGIAADVLPGLFSAYESHAKKQGGTSLGLPIVKEIVAAHGGSVEVASPGVPGQGSVFTVALPLRR